MKKLLKLVTAALLAWVATAPAQAAPPVTAITIYSEQGQPFSLVLDGRLLTRPLARQVHLEWLAPGRHWADFSVPTAYGPPLRFRTSVWLQPGLATDYVLVLRPYGPQLRQVNAVALSSLGGYGPGTYTPGGGYPQPPSGYYGGPTRQNQGGYNQERPPQPGGYYDNGQQSAPYGNQSGYPNGEQSDTGSSQPNTSPNNGQYGNGGNELDNQRNPSYPPTPGSNYPNQSNGKYPVPNEGYVRKTPGVSTLSLEEAADLANAMRRQPSDDERLDMAKQTLDQTSVRSEDLAALLQTLRTEDARVELAEFGYEHVADPQNFDRVYSAFQSSASVREVQQAVGIQH